MVILRAHPTKEVTYMCVYTYTYNTQTDCPNIWLKFIPQFLTLQLSSKTDTNLKYTCPWLKMISFLSQCDNNSVTRQRNYSSLF